MRWVALVLRNNHELRKSRFDPNKVTKTPFFVGLCHALLQVRLAANG
jgi:hypothetical protein